LKRPHLIYIAFLFIFSSCATFNPSVLFRDNPNFQFDKFTTGPDSLYRLAANDIVNVRILTNNGENLINVTGDVESNNTSSNSQFGGIPILVEYDGTAKLPLIGRIKLAGLTRREAEDKLEELFKDKYKDPYITITFNNRKVLVFPGTGNNAKVVSFTGDNMNLIEALAEVGGISNTGKAKKVKLIRGDLKNPKVYKIDLSTLEGMKEADLALQSGDIIYVDPYEDPTALFSKNVSPYLAILGSIASVITSVAVIIALTK
jgi:polysaccharide export outer membrane protein